MAGDTMSYTGHWGQQRAYDPMPQAQPQPPTASPNIAFPRPRAQGNAAAPATARKARLRWTDPMTEVLIDLLNKAILEGHHGSNGFPDQIWVEADGAVSAVTVGFDADLVDKSTCKTRYETLKKEWRTWRDLIKNFPLDHNGNVNASDPRLTRYMEANPLAKKYCKQPLKFEQQLNMLFRDDLAGVDRTAALANGDMSTASFTTGLENNTVRDPRRDRPAVPGRSTRRPDQLLRVPAATTADGVAEESEGSAEVASARKRPGAQNTAARKKARPDEPATGVLASLSAMVEQQTKKPSTTIPPREETIAQLVFTPTFSHFPIMQRIQLMHALNRDLINFYAFKAMSNEERAEFALEMLSRVHQDDGV